MKKPFFIVNPKSYLYGDDIRKMAGLAETTAKKYDLDCLFTAQLIDLADIAKNHPYLMPTAQNMESLRPGRGMGHILPEALKERGVKAVVLNHAENQITLAEIDARISRAKELDLMTIVCVDTPAQSRAVASLHPDAMICEPNTLIGTGETSNEEYILSTTKAIRAVDPNILIMQAAGVSTGEDVTKVMKLGADGTGGTSGIINAPDWEEKLDEMMAALVAFK